MMKYEGNIWSYHQSYHDWQAVSDFIGRFDEDDRKADGHSDHAPKEGGCANQSEGPGVDVHS